MGIIDERAILAAHDDVLFSQFAKEQTHFIINCAYRATHRFISQSDDEWSISLIAFSNAVKGYDQEKGGFLPYAELLIKRSLVDYYRTTKKFDAEYFVSPEIFEFNSKDEEAEVSMKLEIAQKLSTSMENSLGDEIESVNAEFKSFGFSFYDLAQCSPKSQKTKNACKQAVLYVLEHPIVREEINQSKQLPIKLIQKNTNLPRKILENHRRYIIAVIKILSGEYPLLAEYLSFIRKVEM